MVDKVLEQLIEDFGREKLIQFYKQCSDNFRPVPVSEDYSNYLPEGDGRFGKIEQIGQIDYEKQAKTIAFFVCPVSGELSEKDSKKKQYEIGKKILKDNYRDAGIFVFHGDKNFRLSLIAASYFGPKREFTTFRRYTYFVSPDLTNKTFKDQLKKCDFSSIETILEAFSIEAVNEEFYKQIAQKFTDLVGGWLKIGSKKYERDGCLIWPDNSDEKRKEFAVRLIGRLVFCWFLKKKHSEPANVPLVPKDILSLDAANNNDGYHHFVLEPLFFQVLNKKLNDRHKKYKNNGWDKIPFLNGGLFTPHSDDHYEPDEFQGISPRGDVKVPDEWFRELLEIFERYNFTIDENTPVDIEISIDPEMLGRIFENLLAMINPQTGETARKSTGSYYTPRPIVEYMVDQSIKQYLLTQTNIPEENIDLLLDYSQDVSDANLTDKQNDSVIDALDKLKVLDPACGSGAFPIGILQKILLILQKVDPDSTKWKTRLLAKIPNSTARKTLAEKLETETWQYIHKLGVIQNSIYGVDIQPIAAEISKLRAFLSLVVDETVNDTAENRGILSLPNLEFKFVCANTLIGLPETESQKGKMRGKKLVESKGQTSMFEATDDIAELKGVIDNYFTSYGEEKIKLEQQFYEIQSKLRQHMLNSGQTDTQTAKLADWEPFGHDSCPWFDPKWMFGIKDGFDVVIANPPYIEFKKLPAEEKSKFSNYFSAKGKYDIYVIFDERSNSLLKSDGVLCFIQPTTFMKKDFGEAIRKFIKQNFKIKTILDFADIQVFEGATNYTGVLLLSKSKLPKNYKFHCHQYLNTGKSISIADFQNSLCDNNTSSIKNFLEIKDVELEKTEWNFQTDSTNTLLSKFSVNTKPLSEITESIFQGIASGKDEVFYVNYDTIKEFNIEKGILKKLLKGKDIKKYVIDWAGYYVIYPYDKNSQVLSEATLKNEYPNAFAYLKECREMLKGRDYFDNSPKKWFELWNQRSFENFKMNRIISPEITDKNNFVLSNSFYGNTKTYHIIPKDKSTDNYYYLLGLFVLCNFIFVL
jgi:hypothetical protein